MTMAHGLVFGGMGEGNQYQMCS